VSTYGEDSWRWRKADKCSVSIAKQMLLDWEEEIYKLVG
jgi:hypothetical protein